MASGEHGEKEKDKPARKRKSMWDTDQTGKEAKPDPKLAAVAAAAGTAQEVRALAQQRVSEASALSASPSANKGPILKIDMPKDAATGRHKGFCFVEFATADAAATALSTMQDFILAGRNIKVGRPNNFAATVNPSSSIVFANVAQQAQLLQGSSSPSANLLQAKMQAQAVAAAISQQKLLSTDLRPSAPASNIPSTKIYVGSVYYEIKEDDIKAIFSAFGPIKSCQLLPNPDTGKHKGYGFIEYESEASATAAIASMNGFELAGRQIKVGWASASTVPSTPAVVIPKVPVLQPPPVADVKESAKIAPSPCVVLLNMVGPDEVDEELKSEVTEECGKYGAVEKVVIYQEDESKQPVDAPVRIFVLFSSESESQKALKALHGRWFGGRQVLARFFEMSKFEKEDYTL